MKKIKFRSGARKNLVLAYTAWGYTDGDFFDNFNELVDLITKSCK